MSNVSESLPNNIPIDTAIYEQMSDIFQIVTLIYNKQGSIVDYSFYYVNKAFEKQTGLSKENVLGKSAKELFGNTKDN